MKNRYVLLGDLLLIPVAAFAAFAGRFDLSFLAQHDEFWSYVYGALAIKPVIFTIFGMYRRYWRYASVQELLLVVIAVTVSTLAMVLYTAIAFGLVIDRISRVVLFNDWLMTLVTAGGLRMAIRILGERAEGRASDGAASKRVLVVGAGAAGTLVVREMRRNPQLNMEPIGFLDDDADKIGKYLTGVRVLGTTSLLDRVAIDHNIDHVVIAMPTAAGSAVRRVVEQCRGAGLTSQTIPGIYELLGGNATINRLRTVEIEDLLRRAPVNIGTRPTDVWAGKVVLVTGAGGSIGSELARQIAVAPPSLLILLGHGENSLFEQEARLRQLHPGLRIRTVVADIRDNHRLEQIFSETRPHQVFHAAAHKHVPLMEENPEEVVTNNVIGTQNIITHALKAGTERLVMISTDKAVAPSSYMGATKRVAEAMVRLAAEESGRAFVVVRFGNVLGSRGSVVNTFKDQIARGGPVTVTHPEMTRFFMTIPEAVHLVLEASAVGRGGELFVLEMGEPVRIVDLAQDLIELSGLQREDVPIVFTGVRPGEKLHERLFDPEMRTTPTAHPQVLRVEGSDSAAVPTLHQLVDKLAEAARAGDRGAIEQVLKAIVPSFQRPVHR